ncbi:large ribosomal subunit protein bL34m [Bemisia tabaci]
MQALNILRSGVVSRSYSFLEASRACWDNDVFRSFSRINSVLMYNEYNWQRLYKEPRPYKRPRTPTRDYMPRANEQKRLVTHGWLVRMMTPSGRRTIMRRILKGKHVLSH